MATKVYNGLDLQSQKITSLASPSSASVVSVVSASVVVDRSRVSVAATSSPPETPHEDSASSATTAEAITAAGPQGRRVEVVVDRFVLSMVGG